MAMSGPLLPRVPQLSSLTGQSCKAHNQVFPRSLISYAAINTVTIVRTSLNSFCTKKFIVSGDAVIGLPDVTAATQLEIVQICLKI